MHCTPKRIAVKNDEFEIKVKVAGRLYPVCLKRGDERQEYLIRQAATRIQQLELGYRQHFVKSLDDRDILAMAAIEIARNLVILEEKNDTKPFTHKIQQLTATLEDYLRNQTEPDDDFDFFCAISKYNIKKSSFFTPETSKMISEIGRASCRERV